MSGKKCKVCDNQTSRSNAKYCSEKCRNVGDLVDFDCPVCGKAFKRNKHQAKRTKTNVCSRKCARKFNSERFTELNKELNPDRMTFETRTKLRESRLAMNLGEGKAYRKKYSRHLHRVVAEEKIGRKLKKGEVVHHKDGNKLNNNPDNLQVLASQAEHARLHALENKLGHKKKI